MLWLDRTHFTAVIEYLAELCEAHCETKGLNPFGTISAGYVLIEGYYCKAVIDVVARLAGGLKPRDDYMMNLRITLGGDVDLVFDKYLTFSAPTDRLPVRSASMRLSDGETFTALQRAPGTSDSVQLACSGQIRLFWLAEEYCLVLAFS